MSRLYDHLEVLLEAAAVICLFAPQIQGGGGHASKFFIVLEGGIGVMAKVADPGAPESIRQADREVAGYRLLGLLGWHDLSAVTVRRTITDPKSGVALDAAVQIMWPDNQPASPVAGFPADVIMRAGIFDILIEHEDRGGQNWLGVPKSGDQAHLVLIDNGNSLRGAAVNSAFAQAVMGQPLTSAVKAGLSLLVSDLTSGRTHRLTPYLQQAELDGIKQRAEAMLLTEVAA
jgi:hypothetical protein